MPYTLLTGTNCQPDALQKELALSVHAPEGNGCAERFVHTLEENLLWVQTCDSVEQLRQALLEFRDAYDATWLIERHGSRPPAAIRAVQLPTAALAA